MMSYIEQIYLSACGKFYAISGPNGFIFSESPGCLYLESISFGLIKTVDKKENVNAPIPNPPIMQPDTKPSLPGKYYQPTDSAVK